MKQINLRLKTKKNLINKSTEDGKSEEQLTQSTVSGKPSPFIGSPTDFQIIRPKTEFKIIRNKSHDNLSESTIFLENRYRKTLQLSKIQCNYELYEITKYISQIISNVTRDSYSWHFLKRLCNIIGEFIEDNNLHKDTDKLVNIIVKFDQTKQDFVKALMVPSNNVEVKEF